jgi:hypothetical protein
MRRNRCSFHKMAKRRMRDVNPHLFHNNSSYSDQNHTLLMGSTISSTLLIVNHHFSKNNDRQRTIDIFATIPHNPKVTFKNNPKTTPKWKVKTPKSLTAHSLLSPFCRKDSSSKRANTESECLFFVVLPHGLCINSLHSFDDISIFHIQLTTQHTLPHHRCLKATKHFPKGSLVYKGSCHLVAGVVSFTLHITQANGEGGVQVFEVDTVNSVKDSENVNNGKRQLYGFDGFM